MHPGKPRKWTISGWYPSDPGSGGVYVDGPALEPGESVTVTEQAYWRWGGIDYGWFVGIPGVLVVEHWCSGAKPDPALWGHDR